MGVTTWGVLLLVFLLQVFPPARQAEPRLPSGKSRKLAVLQDDYEKSKKDVAEIIELAQKLEEDIEKNREFVVDIRSIRRAEKIEKLAKGIKNRMKRMQ